MGKKRNYNQDYFKVGSSPQPGDDVVQEEQKRQLGETPEAPPRPRASKSRPPARRRPGRG